MAININPSFTGKGTGIELPQGSAVQAQQGLNQMILESEKLRYQVYEKNRNEFLKNASIDPVFVLSDSARKYISKRIEGFNQKYGKIAQQSNYNLSEEDRLNMQTERNLIEAEQQSALAQYELFKQHRDAVAKDPNRYDKDKFALMADQYMKTGVYDSTMPPIKPLAPGSAIRTLAQKLEGVNPAEVVKGKMRGIETYPFPSEKEAQDFAQEVLLKNDQYMLGALEEWGMLPQATKDTYLIDENRDKTISESEQQNGIMKWMRERYGKEAMQPQYSNWRTATEGKSKTKVGIGWQRMEDIRYGNTDYSNNYSFKTPIPVDNVPLQQNVAKRHRATVTLPITKNGSIKGQILEYNPDKDVLIVRATVGNNALGIESQDAIEIPASSLPGINDIVVEIDGKETTMGALRGNKTTGQTKVETDLSSLFSVKKTKDKEEGK